ncbi:lysozyme family protein [Radiobacillus sp. PE A8.2]|uniref:lysozyme family protein n=1 Tax=Radiobacillus sp. PE A8.2 TaxID=3380349 RepID=UPI00388FDE48
MIKVRRKQKQKLFSVVATTFFVMISLFVYISLSKQFTTIPDQPAGPKLSQRVIDYQPIVGEELRKYGKEAYTGIVLSLMMQESAGRGMDPMQASESYCGEVGCIDDPALSIQQGAKYFSYVLDKAGGDVKLALQSYNFGEGFITYVQEHGGNYTKQLAIDFSAMMYDRLRDTGNYSCLRDEAVPHDACYGDILYVDAVLGYYATASNLDDNGSWVVSLTNEEE